MVRLCNTEPASLHGLCLFQSIIAFVADFRDRSTLETFDDPRRPSSRKIALSHARRCRMERALAGCLILIAEDDPLIATDITQAFEDEGARVITAHTLNEALCGVEDPALSAAILDHALSDGDSSTVCKRMKERNIPFVTYSGYDPLGGVCREGVRVMKPASMSLLVATVKGLLSERQISTQTTNWRALIDYACAQPSASPLT